MKKNIFKIVLVIIFCFLFFGIFKVEVVKSYNQYSQNSYSNADLEKDCPLEWSNVRDLKIATALSAKMCQGSDPVKSVCIPIAKISDIYSDGGFSAPNVKNTVYPRNYIKFETLQNVLDTISMGLRGSWLKSTDRKEVSNADKDAEKAFPKGCSEYKWSVPSGLNAIVQTFNPGDGKYYITNAKNPEVYCFYSGANVAATLCIDFLNPQQLILGTNLSNLVWSNTPNGTTWNPGVKAEAGTNISFSVYVKNSKWEIKGTVNTGLVTKVDFGVDSTNGSISSELSYDTSFGNKIKITINTQKLKDNHPDINLSDGGTYSITMTVTGSSGDVFYLSGSNTITLNLTAPDCKKYDNDKDKCTTINPTQCFWVGSTCEWRFNNNESLCKTLKEDQCGCGGTGTECGTKTNCSCVCSWKKASDGTGTCHAPVMSSLIDQYPEPPSNWLMPPCAFSGSCRDVGDLMSVLINFANWLFSIIGILAFVFFVYGGLTMILSFGSAEKVKKGRDILVAAVVGMIIAFGAVLLIKFVLDALGVGTSFIAGGF